MAAYPFGRQTRKEWLFSDEKLHYKVWLTSHRRNPPPPHPLAPETSSSPRPLSSHWRRKQRWRPCALFKARHASSTTLRASPKLQPHPPSRWGRTVGPAGGTVQTMHSDCFSGFVLLPNTRLDEWMFARADFPPEVIPTEDTRLSTRNHHSTPPACQPHLSQLY